MKMKEVCSRTGLTERAVRLYLEKGLLSPRSEWRQGRTYHDFSEEDISHLHEIAALRSVDFSLEDIGEMERDGSKTNLLLQKRLAELRAESVDRQKTLELLEPLENIAWHNSGELARAVQNGGVTTSNLDAEPDFGRADGLTREEKQRLSQEAHRRIARSDRFRKWVAAGCAALLLCGAAVGYWYWQQTHSMLSCITYAGDAVFSQSMLMEDRDGNLQMAAYVTVNEWKADFLGVFRGESGQALFKGYFPETDYLAICFEVQISRRDAQKLGLLDGELLDVERVRQKVITDDDFCLQYLTIREYQAISAN